LNHRPTTLRLCYRGPLKRQQIGHLCLTHLVTWFRSNTVTCLLLEPYYNGLLVVSPTRNASLNCLQTKNLNIDIFDVYIKWICRLSSSPNYYSKNKKTIWLLHKWGLIMCG
jgi:hypothetical protein